MLKNQPYKIHLQNRKINSFNFFIEFLLKLHNFRIIIPWNNKTFII